jgi:hypothetical protein
LVTYCWQEAYVEWRNGPGYLKMIRNFKKIANAVKNLNTVMHKFHVAAGNFFISFFFFLLPVLGSYMIAKLSIDYP